MLLSELSPRSPLAVRRENVILVRYFRMTRKAASDGARASGLNASDAASGKVSGTLTKKGASVFFFGYHSIFAILEPSGNGLPLPGPPARQASIIV